VFGTSRITAAGFGPGGRREAGEGEDRREAGGSGGTRGLGRTEGLGCRELRRHRQNGARRSRSRDSNVSPRGPANNFGVHLK
jgi:hypothetical protein